MGSDYNLGSHLPEMIIVLASSTIAPKHCVDISQGEFRVQD